MAACGTTQVVTWMFASHSRSSLVGICCCSKSRCALEAITAVPPSAAILPIGLSAARVGAWVRGWHRFRSSLREGRDDLAAAAARPHQTIADVARHIAAQLRAMGALEHQVRAACAPRGRAHVYAAFVPSVALHAPRRCAMARPTVAQQNCEGCFGYFRVLLGTPAWG